MVSLKKQSQKYMINAKSIYKSKLNSDNQLIKSLEILNGTLKLNPEINSYYCLQEDHAFIFGSNWIEDINVKYLTTIRSPIDMLASKKHVALSSLW